VSFISRTEKLSKCPGGTRRSQPGMKCLGTAVPSKEPSRRVRYDEAQLTPEVFSSKCAPYFLRPNSSHPCTNHTVPYGAALLGWRCPRHFVPGYDRTVPPGRRTSQTALNFVPFNPGLSSPAPAGRRFPKVKFCKWPNCLDPSGRSHWIAKRGPIIIVIVVMSVRGLTLIVIALA
jgi:hypothetical protein